MKLLNVILFAALAVAVQTEKVPVRKFNGNRRIYDGKLALKKLLPYQAAIVFTPAGESAATTRKVCGGSLISSTRVLTAAHCAIEQSSALVILGAIKLFEHEPTQVRIDVPLSGIVYHPEYDDNTLHNDIAMIKLPSAVTFNDHISPIALPEGSDDYVGDTVTASGWGDYDETFRPSPFLRYVDLKVITNSKCFEDFDDIIDSIICAKGNENDAGCDGDSGGPLAVNKNGKRILVGVLSFLANCGHGLPTGFTRVTFFVPWIKSNM